MVQKEIKKMIHNEEKNKCERCRYKKGNTNKCIAANSPFYMININTINNHTNGEGCYVFYSENDEENISQTKLDTVTGSL
jgi:hypothetical protein